MTKTITYNQLVKLGACSSGLDDFEKIFGRGEVEVTVENCLKVDFNHINWLGGVLFDDEYEKARKPIWDEYEKARKPLRDEYLKARKPLRDEYEKAEKPLWDEYEKAEKPLWDEYLKARKPSWDEYERNVCEVICKLYNEGK